MPVTRDASPAAAPTPDDIVDMDAVVVSGVLPGPRMWRVSKGDNDLYILGTLPPLPKRMEWMSREVEDTIPRSAAENPPPSVPVHSELGFFRRLAPVTALLRARNHPGKRNTRAEGSR